MIRLDCLFTTSSTVAFHSPGYNYLCLDRTSPPPPPPYPESKHKWQPWACATYDRVSPVYDGWAVAISSHQFVQHSSPPNPSLLPCLDFCGRRLPLLPPPIVHCGCVPPIVNTAVGGFLQSSRDKAESKQRADFGRLAVVDCNNRDLRVFY